MGGGQSSPLQVSLEPVKTMVFPSLKSSGILCPELPRRDCRISVRVNR
jgi:hypothetical protein